MNNLGMARQSDMYRGPPMCPPDFKPPAETQMPTAPSNPKKRRKAAANANNAIQPTPLPTPADLLPPPLSGYGDTIIASNPFDDTPSPSSMNSMSMAHINHMNMNHHHPHHHPHPHMNPHSHMGPAMRGMSPMMMNMQSMPPHMAQMNPHQMNNRGGMSPMAAQMGGLSPMGMSPIHAHAMGRSMSGSPLGPSPMVPMGSPMGNTISSPLGSGPMNNGPLGNPMHSPLGNPGPNRMNGGNMPVNQSQQSPHPHMQGGNGPPNLNMGGGGPNMMSNNNSNGNNTPVNHNSPTTPMPQHSSGNNNMGNQGGGPSNNSIPGSNNNNNGPHQQTTNSSNMNQMTSHPGMNSMGPMGNNPGMNSMPPNAMGGMYGGPKPMPVSAGKIYPVDTPMVFNPQNPNAPPIYPCGVCHKEVHDNDQGLLCESGCNFWFHRTCSGLTEAAYQLIHFEVYAEWCCDKCLQSKNIPMVKFKP